MRGNLRMNALRYLKVNVVEYRAEKPPPLPGHEEREEQSAGNHCHGRKKRPQAADALSAFSSFRLNSIGAALIQYLIPPNQT